MTTAAVLAGSGLDQGDFVDMTVDLYNGSATDGDFVRLGAETQARLLGMMRRNNRILLTLSLTSGAAAVLILWAAVMATSTFATVVTIMSSVMATAVALAFGGSTWFRSRQIRRLARLAH